jgi:hypothetical protein
MKRPHFSPTVHLRQCYRFPWSGQGRNLCPHFDQTPLIPSCYQRGKLGGTVVSPVQMHAKPNATDLITCLNARTEEGSYGGGYKKECLVPCSGPTAAALPPHFRPPGLRLGLLPGRRPRLWAWAWAQRGDDSPRQGAAGAMAPGWEPVDPGPGRRQGTKGRRSWRTWEGRGLLVIGA